MVRDCKSSTHQEKVTHIWCLPTPNIATEDTQGLLTSLEVMGGSLTTPSTLTAPSKRRGHGESSLSLPKDTGYLGVTGKSDSATTSGLAWEASLSMSYSGTGEKISDFEFIYLKQHQAKEKVLRSTHHPSPNLTVQ